MKIFQGVTLLPEDAAFMAECEAGRGKTLAAMNAYADGGGVYLRVWESLTQAAFLQALCFEVDGSRPHGSNR